MIYPDRRSREAFYAGYVEGFREGQLEEVQQAIRFHAQRERLLRAFRDEGGEDHD